MSLKTIKTTLENYLNANVTTTAIKWNNTATLTLNSVVQTPEQVDALTMFIEPKVVPVSQDRELLSSAKPRKFEMFFQIDIYNKVGAGTGAIYSMIELLDAVFVEETVTGVVVSDSKALNSFVVGDWNITPVRYLAHTWA